MWLKWLPWKYVVRKIAKAQGFVDPISILSRLHGFAEPSEVAAPLELLRAGVVFHARGLMNSGVIQHNLDWIWPYWVERQFDPLDESFIPRAFSITHVNLTHRNWTAVGRPNLDLLPIVDPRGLLTPYWDSWSIDGWMFRDDGARLIPSQSKSVRQELVLSSGVAVTTEAEASGMHLRSSVEVTQDGPPLCQQRWHAQTGEPAWLAIAVRPYNPEGVSFVHQVQLSSDRCSWLVNDRGHLTFSAPADRHVASDYQGGDVASSLLQGETNSTTCEIGMATAAALFRVPENGSREITVSVPMEASRDDHWAGWNRTESRVAKLRKQERADRPITWHEATADAAQLQIPSEQFQFLYQAALRTLVLHMPGEVYPGPYTYKRFWIRDTAFIVHAALVAGMKERARRALEHILARQRANGYFQSQEGEWDSNGQALWILQRFCELTGEQPLPVWDQPVVRGADWILKKRLPSDSGSVAAGLLPAGFSAEHLGPNDHYYWDDYWSIAGLRAAAVMMECFGRQELEQRFEDGAAELLCAIDRSLAATSTIRQSNAIPAAPGRRMDAGAIGSLAASYPLQVLPADDERLSATVEFLREHCFVKGAFFQDMIHSGINAYLTLHVAQVLLRRGCPEWLHLVEAVAGFASPTGQWPEAIHPATGGGCMGDGQHVWAAAEWLLAMRNMFVREETGGLIVASGIPSDWLNGGELSFGPTPTRWGPIKVCVEPTAPKEVRVSWSATWRGAPPEISVELSGFPPQTVDGSVNEVMIRPLEVTTA